MSSRPVIFNGKFLSARPTGVHRVGRVLVERIDRLVGAEASPPHNWSLACPSNADRPIDLGCIKRRQVGLLTWQAWEQIELPISTGNGLLVNFCNMAPLSNRGSITMIHDAHVFLTPESSSRLFTMWYRFALPLIGASAAQIVTVSEFSRQKLIEHNIAPADKITVIHNGVDHLMDVPATPAALERLGLHDRPYVMASANVQRHKNIRLLFEAFRRPEMQGLTLALNGPDGRDLFERAGLDPPDNVVFTGHVPDGVLRALYEHAVCLAFPSTTEGFGLPPLEAMSFGCPTIVAPCGALPEVCGTASIYQDPDDAAAWADSVLELQRGGQTRRDLIAAGRQQVARFQWANSARQMLDLIRLHS